MLGIMTAVEILSKANDIKALLAQERLETVIEVLQEMGDVHIKTAGQELEEARRSTRPEKECDRAIGQFKVAANAMMASLEKRPLIKRLARVGKYKRMLVYFKVTGCYAMITALYRVQGNIALAKQYAARAAQTFEQYASLRGPLLRSWLFTEFTYNCGTDQMPKVCVSNTKELQALLRRYGIANVVVYETTLGVLATNIVADERRRLIGWMSPLELL